MQGGRRSRKTWSTFEYLFALCGVMGGQKVTVLTYQYSQLQATMDDFKQCLHVPIVGSVQDGLTAYTRGGTQWQFVHCDDPTKAQGTQCDFLFVNEAVNVPQKVIDVYVMGCRRQVLYNFNPTAHFQQLESHGNGNNLLLTTWRDNPYLTDQQREEFEAIKARAMSKGATIWDEYQYRVYYLGEFSTMAGRVFPRVETCSEEEFDAVPTQQHFGLDFGFSVDGDPTAMVGVKVHGGALYVREYIYERGLTSDRALAARIIGCGCNVYTPIFCDIGGLGRTRMNTIRMGGNGEWDGEIARGLDLRPASKGSIMDGLSAMLTNDRVVVTEKSENARREFEQYSLVDGKPRGGDDHAIDAARYAYMTGYRFYQ